LLGRRGGRNDYASALQCVLEADAMLHAGRNQDGALRVFARRGIHASHRTGVGARA